MKKKPYRKKMTVAYKQYRWSARVPALYMLILFVLCGSPAKTQPDSTTVNKKKINTFILVSGVSYAAGLITLNHVWYNNTERQSFRFFNDNAEWKQVDKTGHFYSAFYLSELPARALRNYGMAETKADFAGAIAGFLLTLPIEIFDGFSDGYGASAGDLIADAAGPAFYLGQKLTWREIRIRPKFSFHRTGYAPLRPALLGDNPLSEFWKDYNGQTYWLSVDVDKFISFPHWLNIAFGYGAHDMIFARDNQNRSGGFDPYRQYYLAVDLDVSGIRTRSKWIKSLLYVASAIRLPAPAFEFSRKGQKFHPFYF